MHLNLPYKMCEQIIEPFILMQFLDVDRANVKIELINKTIVSWTDNNGVGTTTTSWYSA